MASVAKRALTMSPPPDNLPALVAEAQRDPGAFGALYDRFVQPVYRYVRRRVGNPPDAEDLTAQVFLTALESLPRYRENGYFAAWLFTIARSKVTDYFRSHRPEVAIEAAESYSLDPNGSHGTVENDEMEQLSQLIRDLRDDEQELIRLRYVADLRFAEIAVVLKKNEAAVKKSLYRLLARLERQMEARHD